MWNFLILTAVTLGGGIYSMVKFDEQNQILAAGFAAAAANVASKLAKCTGTLYYNKRKGSYTELEESADLDQRSLDTRTGRRTPTPFPTATGCIL